ncbi:hypothetical protein EBU24_07020 [bacterium]|nr:hypothetical protein [bacterium]
MIKYKICKFVDGNGEEWYQIKKARWLFWYYMSSYTGIGSIRTVDKFFTLEQAQKYIKDDIEYTKRRIIKKVECIDYV